MGRNKDKLFGNSLDNLVKRAEEELKSYNNSLNNDSSSNILSNDSSKASKKINKKSDILLRYTVRNVPPEIQEFIQFFTKHEEGKLNLDKYEKEDAILVSGLFKNFLAEMSGRIIPYKIYLKLKDAKTNIEMKEILRELPLNHHETLNYINQFVLIINDHCETNYMNLSNLSIVFGPNLFELTNDEMVNLNITVVSSEIYKNILKIRKTERDTAEGIISCDNEEKIDNESAIIKNLDGSMNVISELPQSYTSINEVLNNAANSNLQRRNSIIKTIFIDHIKDKIQKRKSSISLSVLKLEKKKSDLQDESGSERIKSDEYHECEVFNIDKCNSMSKIEPTTTDDGEEEGFKYHFAESSDDSYTCPNVCNQDSELSPDNTNNMETINEESYDSLSASHKTLNKNSNDKITFNNDQGLREKKKYHHNNNSMNSENKSYNNSELDDEDEGMSLISSIEDIDSILKHKSKLSKESLYFDAASGVSEDSDDINKNDETIEIIENEISNKNNYDENVNDVNNKDIFYSTDKVLLDNKIVENNNNSKDESKNNDNDYLTNEEIVNMVSSKPIIKGKSKKFNTIGPKSNIKFKLEDEESNLKDYMSTTNLNDENDPSQFLNKKLENYKDKESKTSLSKNFSRIIKTNKNTFESNMAFINKTFDDSDGMLSKGSNYSNDKYTNSNYSIFYEKIENKEDDPNNETLDMNDGNSERSSKEEENSDYNGNTEEDDDTFDSEIEQKQFIPLKGKESDDENEIQKEYNEKEYEIQIQKNNNDVTNNNPEKSNDMEETNDKKENNNMKEADDEKENNDMKETNDEKENNDMEETDDEKENNDIDEANNIENDFEKESSNDESNITNISNNGLISVDESIYENIKEYDLTHEKSSSFSHYKRSIKRHSKRNPRCFSKSDAAALSLINFELENINVNNFNDKDLDNLDLNKIREIQKEKEKEKESIKEKKTEELIGLNSKYYSYESNESNSNGSNSNVNNEKQSSKLITNKRANNIKNINNNTLISDEIKKRLEYKRKKDNRPNDLSKMTFSEIMKEKKAIKQELLLLKSIYNHYQASKSNGNFSEQKPSNNNNDFINKSLSNAIESTNSTVSKINENSQAMLPPLNYNDNSKIISKKLQKADIRYMKELYQKLEKLKQEKLALQIKLKNFQEEFVEKNGRPIKTLEDQKPIRIEKNSTSELNQ
ncbi:hypothetical protein U3516DRAFT_671145 [Neocallimastix sp. 'constans']